MAAREVMEEEIVSYEVNANKWKPLAPNALSPASLEEVGNALINASCPVVVTTYLGREEQAVTELVKLCETLGVAVLVRYLLAPNSPLYDISLTPYNRKHSQPI
jgi:acetolactate synthase-1/2/3 large subunit